MDPYSSDNEAEGAPSPPGRYAARRRSSQQYDGILYSPRAPPSAFPFQAYPGNPDPLPKRSRRASLESLPRKSFNFSDDSHEVSAPGSLAHEELSRPVAPFMSESGHAMNRNGSQQNTLYRNSAAATLTPKGSSPNLNESSRPSSMIFRTPFLSPSSRSSSTVWTPPVYPVQLGANGASPNGSTAALGLPIRKAKPPARSTMLTEKLTEADKPWLAVRPPNTRLSKFLTYFFMLLGLVGAALICFIDLRGLQLLDESKLCTVFEDDFSSGSLDTSIWTRTVQLGGFGTGEFEAMTGKDENLKIQNGNLYIIPTLTSTEVDSIFSGSAYTLDGCTSTNQSACSVTPDEGTNTVIPPVQSAYISTNGTHSIKYGRVQVRAKIPRGDWLWPRIWMLPVNATAYGDGFSGGEIDIMEARGNDASYPAQGFNYVRSSLNYGPLPTLYTQIFGWWTLKRGGFNDDFHTYTLEWTQDWMRLYVDSRLQSMLDLSLQSTKDSFFSRGNYPIVTESQGLEIPVTNIYNSSSNAPFNQDFYLIISLAAGGTSGWFPDSVGGKPWTDGELDASYLFAQAQSNWSATWPSSSDDLALRVDWVKMWGMC